MEKLIDIIIPAYNAHDTIARTLFSICLQDIKDNISVYIIDDASEKPYDYLIDDFKDRLDINIYRLDKNSGPGVCRNKGLEISKNEFIMFIDADDMFVNNLSVSMLFNNIGENDLAVGMVEFENPDKTVTYFNNHNRCLHGKMYRRSYLDKYEIRFTNTYRHEDSAFHEIILMTNPKVFYTKNPTYFYTFNEKSLTNIKSGEEEFNTFKDYVDNTMFAINQGLKHNLDIKIMTEISIQSLMYLYFEYHNNYMFDYKDKLFEWIKPLVVFYKEHQDLITDEKLKEVYDLYHHNYIGDIKISFEDFINK